MLRYLLLVALILIVTPLLEAEEKEVDKNFFFACSGGEVDDVWKHLQEHPGES